VRAFWVARSRGGAGRRKANLRRFLAESVVTVDHMIVDTACTVSPDAFLDETPTAVMIRRILGSVSQFEKAMLVAKLKGARDRKRAATGKCGGRKSYAERKGGREMVALAKKLARYTINGRKGSLRDIAAELEINGHVAAGGKRYTATAVSRMAAA
jgi:DNA invertase Pin-like site-specific DNA recombinase